MLDWPHVYKHIFGILNGFFFTISTINWCYHRTLILCVRACVFVYIEDIQWFDVEYGIYFTSETWYFIFSRVRNTRENVFLKTCLTIEINSILNVKTLNFLFIYYISFGFLFKTCFFLTHRHCTQHMAWRHNHLLFNVKIDKITFCEDITSIQWTNPVFYDWKYNNSLIHSNGFLYALRFLWQGCIEDFENHADY